MKSIFLIGIGGVGMSNLAILAKNLGYKVWGSDIKLHSGIHKLRKLGIKVFIGHDRKNIISCQPDLVIYSSAIPLSNPELAWAKKNNIKISHRYDFLMELTGKYRVIGIGGTHGKTTTASMIAFVLQELNLLAFCYIGASNKTLKTKIHPSRHWVVIETDESDQSFMHTQAEIGIVTNIDKDHLSNYEWSFSKLKSAFKRFLEDDSKRKWNIVCADDVVLRGVIQGIKNKNIIKYGFDYDADLVAKDIRFTDGRQKAEIFFKNKKVGLLKLKAPGSQNVSNSLAAILACFKAGVPMQKTLDVLQRFELPRRRLEYSGKAQGISIYDDHADHPSEIKSTLGALSVFNKRIVAIYQPHRYTRMKIVQNILGKSFNVASVIIVTDIDSAFEKPIKGINGQRVYEWIKKDNKDKTVIYIPNYEQVYMRIRKILKPDDLIVVLGPGSISNLAKKLFSWLKSSILP